MNDDFFAVDNICPHNHTSQIFDGYVEGMYVAFTVHGFRFHLETGEQPTNMGCKLSTFQIKISNEWIYVKIPEEKRFDFEYDLK